MLLVYAYYKQINNTHKISINIIDFSFLYVNKKHFTNFL